MLVEYIRGSIAPLINKSGLSITWGIPMNVFAPALGSVRAAACGAALVFAVNAALATPAAAFDPKAAERSTLRVAIIAEKDGKKIFAGHGTGFVIDRGYVATNWHVAVPSYLVQQKIAYKLYVIGEEVPNFVEAQAIWTSEAVDLAVLRVPSLDLPPFELTSREPLTYPGKSEPIYVVGYPGASDKLQNPDEAQQLKVFREASITRGIVSRIVVARLEGAGNPRPTIQHDAIINPGNSGGPLFDACNRVVGINTYSTPSQMKLYKTQSGDQVASGQVAPAYISPHVSNLIHAVQTVPELKGIRLHLSSEACTIDEGGASPLLIVFSGVTLLIALGAAGLVVFRRREVVRVVESYSAWVQRKGVSPGAKRTDSAATPRASRPPSGPRRATNVEATEAPAMARAGRTGGTGDWSFSGTDSNKQKVSLAIAPAELDKAMDQAEKGLVLGRSSSMADKVINDPSVSRRHAKLTKTGDTLAIEDLKSAYGTKVNGETLKPFEQVAINPGDTVVIGAVTFEIARR